MKGTTFYLVLQKQGVSSLVLAESSVLVEESMGVLELLGKLKETGARLRLCNMDMMYAAPFFGRRSLLEKGESMKDVNGL